MEPQNRHPNEDGGSNQAAGSSASMLHRESRTRWIPTTDHIRILNELFYNKGVRSPTIEQIQRICLQLKWYGRIEFKNVYFWFVNQRAREKQKKKKLTSDVQVPKQRSGLVGGSIMEQRGEDHQEIKTLPLFPIHGEDIFGHMKTTSDGGGGHGDGSYISLELSLSCEGKAEKSFRSR
ncbi:putative transcription factor Homobox-WOX family [Rosa chinensis]|uniref:Putative transcription factor Homobox-WOX family n=1 Tax=Rosa chinensis TaxID=74649 RepID=A0A2P6RNX6_ROSCH|nr:putative transcription factor Homobox-WOX family [Rosa chinensis]